MTERTLLVTGASGHLGRRIVELLLEQGDERVIAGTRRPEAVRDLALRGAEVRRVDFDDARSLDEAFVGVDRLLIVSSDAIHAPGLRLEQHERALAAAVRAEVGHVVYTSFVAPEPGSPVTIASEHWQTEQRIARLPISYTILRNNLYADLLTGVIEGAATTGALYTARGHGRIAYVTREDCARVGAAVLLSDFDGRLTLDVTGPTALSGEDLARLASERAGRPIPHVSVSPEAYAAGLRAHGLPEVVVAMLASFEVAAARGDFAAVAPTVRELTGRAPTSVRELLGPSPRAAA